MHYVIIGTICPPLRVGVLFTLKGLILDNDGRCSIHYPSYYAATCQNEKLTIAITIGSVDQQRNSPPKTLMSLSNRIHWG